MTGGINYILFILGILSDDTRWKLLTRSLNVIYSLIYLFFPCKDKPELFNWECDVIGYWW